MTGRSPAGPGRAADTAADATAAADLTGGPGQPGWAGHLGLVIASSTGGIGQHVAALVRGLTRTGARVTVCGPAATERQFDFTGGGATFVPVEIPASPQPGDARAVGALRRALSAAAVDLVHAHGLRAGFVAALARTGRPLVVTWHTTFVARGLRLPAHRLLARVVARAADVTLGASTELVSRAVDLGARDARPCLVAAPTLGPPRRARAGVRRELGVAGSGVLILAVGRLHQHKRHDVLIDAAAGWRDLHPVPVVAIAGSGPSYMQLTARISATRAPVTLLGHRTDVADLLGAADLAVLTSDGEARPLFAQEALRAGVPLVATAVGGVPELVGSAAVLVPPGDVAALDAAVRDLLADPPARAELARRGVEQARCWPSEAAMLDQLRRLYAELTAAPGR